MDQYKAFFDRFCPEDGSSLAAPPLGVMPFVGVRSTGIFCRKGCPARIPKFENCQFYPDAQSALRAGFRACKRCHPTLHPNEASATVKKLIALVEANPEQKWSEADLKAQGIDPSTARRHFQKRFDMTFTQYARARRLGVAEKALRKGDRVIDAQLTAGYESASGFRQAFSDRFGAPPNRQIKNAQTKPPLSPLVIEWIDTKLGPMIAICDDRALYLLEFTTRIKLDAQVERLKKTHKRAILPGRTHITDQITNELEAYFNGRLHDFKTPLILSGTKFQRTVWRALQTIPFGHTWSYADLAKAVGRDKGFQAVGSANGSNGLALIIPCHRVIAKDGGLGGYAGGLAAKQWLLDMEKRVLSGAS